MKLRAARLRRGRLEGVQQRGALVRGGGHSCAASGGFFFRGGTLRRRMCWASRASSVGRRRAASRNRYARCESRGREEPVVRVLRSRARWTAAARGITPGEIAPRHRRGESSASSAQEKNRMGIVPGLESVTPDRRSHKSRDDAKNRGFSIASRKNNSSRRSGADEDDGLMCDDGLKIVITITRNPKNNSRRGARHSHRRITEILIEPVSVFQSLSSRSRRGTISRGPSRDDARQAGTTDPRGSAAAITADRSSPW